MTEEYVDWEINRGKTVSLVDMNRWELGGPTFATLTERDTESSGWGSAEIFRACNVTETAKKYYWNGSAWVDYPAAGGAGAPTDASYVTTSAESGLSAEALHKDLTGANLHNPKDHDHTESEITDLDHDAQKVKGKTVDDSAIADNKILQYDSGTSSLKYVDYPAGTGDMTKSTYDQNTNNIVDNSEKLGGYTISQVRSHTPLNHQDSHRDGGSDQITYPLAANARVQVYMDGVAVGTRRRLNFRAGSGITFSGSQDDATNEEVDFNIASTGGSSFQLQPDYTVYYTGGTFWAMDVDGDTQSNADFGALLNTLIGTFSSDYGGVIYVRGNNANMTTTTQVVVNKSNVSIISGRRLYNTSGRPFIQQIQVNASSADIRGTIIDGVSTNEIHLYSNGHAVRETSVYNSYIEKTSTYHGILVQGDGSDAGWQNMNVFVDCKFGASAGGNTYGIVTFDNVKRMTEMYFVRPNFAIFKNVANPPVYCFVAKGQAQVDSLYLVHPRIFSEKDNGGAPSDTARWVIFYQAPSTGAYNVGPYVYWYGGRAELHASCTLLEIPASATQGLRCGFLMRDFAYATDVGTATLFDITNTNWLSTYSNGLMLIGNRMSTDVAIGTFPNTGTGGFINNFRANRGFRTENYDASTVATGTAVNHSLKVATGDETRVHVALTPDGADCGGRWWVSSVTTTQFTINHGGGGSKTFNWHAKYIP